ncbi:MAG: arginyl-transferase family protein [Proteobacteria bacterium]|nr:arginyl-transferase family protein [Pseudomonadota bacterium]
MNYRPPKPNANPAPSPLVLSMRLMPPNPCPYLKGRMEQKLVADIAHMPENYTKLAQVGFRRIEHWVYRPACPGCEECVSLRIASGIGSGKVAADEGRLIHSPSQRRIMRRNQHITRRLLPNVARHDHYALFKAYQQHRHYDGQMHGMTGSDYAALITRSPIPTLVVEYRAGSDLFGVMLVDIQADGLSLVYSFFDPKYSRQSPGNFMILDAARLAHGKGLPYVYLGYYVPSSRKMRYKTQFKPCWQLRGRGWEEIK